MKSIKTKLVISYSILVLAVTLIIGIISLVSGYRSLKEEAEYSLQMMASEGAKLTESRLENLISTLNMIALEKKIQNMDWEVDVKVLKEELAKTDFIDIGFVLPNGYTYYTDGTVRLMSDRSYVREALEGKDRISDVIISRVTRKPEIEVAIPVKKDGEVIGALVGRKAADSLSKITKDIGYGINGYSFMMNGKGTIIAHPDTNKVLERYNPIEEVKDTPQLIALANAFNEMLQNKSGVISFAEENKNLYAGYATIEGTDWSFIITADQKEVMSVIPKLVKRILTIMLLVLLCSFGVVYLLDSTLTKPLIEMTKQSKCLGALDMRENISEKYLKKKDEIGILSGAFHSLTINIREIIRELAESANHVSDTVQKLTDTSQHSAYVSEEISRTVEEIAKGATEQADNIEEGLSQAALLDQKIEINHQHMKNLNTSTTQVMNMVNDGLKDIERLMHMTKENDLATRNICDRILQMKESSEQIGEASRLISEMAGQTNLLALNASIEAARAGEAGKGFSVVAEEIKKMADQSANSTKYIDTIVKGLQGNITKTVESMQRILVTSEGQHQSVTDTIQTYQEISDAMENSEVAVTELNHSEKEMEAANNEIKIMLQSLAAIAEQNAAGTQEAASTMQEQTASVMVIADVSNRLNELAENLRLTITRFQV